MRSKGQTFVKHFGAFRFERAHFSNVFFAFYFATMLAKRPFT